MDEKRKIDVEIAGLKMSLVTDETESFVDSVVRRVNDFMNSLLQSSRNRTRLDAALLCALDFCSDKLTAEKRVRNLEAQISLYDVNLRKARAENAE
ncbi:MAG: cell division protein ZapA, partial [Clostridia bacterium]|nr:cell division protein ZapA [Clostridia bacterium]